MFFQIIPFKITQTLSLTSLNFYTTALPFLNFASSFIFAVLGGMWIYMCRTKSEHVHHIHLLMLVLIGLKMMTAMFHGISFHFVKMYGHPVGKYSSEGASIANGSTVVIVIVIFIS